MVVREGRVISVGLAMSPTPCYVDQVHIAVKDQISLPQQPVSAGTMSQYLTDVHTHTIQWLCVFSLASQSLEVG
jgi:hypothetical protein